MVRAVVMVGVLAAAVEARGETFAGDAGPVEQWLVAPVQLTRAEFLAARVANGVSPTRLRAPRPDVWYGWTAVAGTSVGWTVEGDRRNGYALVVDDNANGDLTDDAPQRFRRDGDHWELHTRQVWMRLEIHGGTPALYSMITRRGSVTVDGERIPFTLVGVGDALSVWDLDGAHAVNGTRTRLRDHDYRVIVRPHGDGIVLERLPTTHVAAHTGDVAPDVETTLTDGSHFSLLEHRGETVLLEFWSPYCPPCKAERGEVEALSHRATVLSLTDEISPEAGPWPHAVEQGTWIHDDKRGDTSMQAPTFAAYDVEHVPDLFVIDPEGHITRAHCRIDQVKDLVGP